MATMINGIVIEGDHKSVVMRGNKIYIDGKLYEPEELKNKQFCGQIIINGNVKQVDCTTLTVNGHVCGNVDGTNITITGDVGGDIDGTNVTVKGSVRGDIDATNFKK